MDPTFRKPFNAAYTPALFERYRDILHSQFGVFTYRLAETPFFIDRPLREHLVGWARELVAQLSVPATLEAMKQAIPAQYNVPGMNPLPDIVQVDFGLVRNAAGGLEGRVVELQGFPSVAALMVKKAEAWNQVLAGIAGMPPRFSCFFPQDEERALQWLGECILGGERPEDVVLVDYRPLEQKTLPDFIATKRFFGVDAVCCTAIRQDGRTLLREKDGKWIPIRRIYNRMVFDELEVKKVVVPFRWQDELDVSWCSHPNWYWVWSKYSLPHLHHPAVPEAQYLSQVDPMPKDLEHYVLKPLFSFAGSGVIFDVTPEHIAAIPPERRAHYLLQRKVDYAWVLETPDGIKTKVEVRVMLLRLWPNGPFEPLLTLVRTSRGKLLGVDQNKAAESKWTGATAGLWPAE